MATQPRESPRVPCKGLIKVFDGGRRVPSSEIRAELDRREAEARRKLARINSDFEQLDAELRQLFTEIKQFDAEVRRDEVVPISHEEAVERFKALCN